MININEEMFSGYPDVLNIEQLQSALNIGRSTAYQIIKDNSLKSMRIGNNIRIPKKYLLEYVYNECYNKGTAIDSPSM